MIYTSCCSPSKMLYDSLKITLISGDIDEWRSWLFAIVVYHEHTTIHVYHDRSGCNKNQSYKTDFTGKRFEAPYFSVWSGINPFFEGPAFGSYRLLSFLLTVFRFFCHLHHFEYIVAETSVYKKFFYEFIYYAKFDICWKL